MVLMRTDPFRELDRLTQQVFGTAARPAVMPMDAWRDGEQFIVEFDLPGVNADSLGLDVERNVLTVRAERPDVDQSREMVTAERPRGVFNPPAVPRGQPRRRQDRGQLPRRRPAAHHPGGGKGQAPPHRNQPRRRANRDQRLTATADVTPATGGTALLFELVA